MNAYPFSIFKRADRDCYSVSFKDQNGKYLAPVSTGKKTEKEAVQMAFLMLRDGVQHDEAAETVHDLSLKDMVRRIKSQTEAGVILSEMKRLGWVKSYVLKETLGDVDFISYLKGFWDWESSPYIKEKLRRAHGIHKHHCLKQGRTITLYWEGFFKGRFLGDITAADIDGFITFMGDKELSAARKNIVIKAGFKALRWAFAKRKIEIDPTRGHIMFTGDEKNKTILPIK